uniref:Uncharacterized protein n=1 Tax=Heterorhabditis bacteriophora TaxID=37862 RepID=A0A1I7WYT2_HETBA
MAQYDVFGVPLIINDVMMPQHNEGSREIDYVAQLQIKNQSSGDNRDRLLQLAEKTLCFDNRPTSGFSPELRPRMGLRAKDKIRNSMFVSEQSLPDKLTQALKNLRPGALVHSASSSAPFRLKNRGAVAADDVVYFAAPETRSHKQTAHYEEIQKAR